MREQLEAAGVDTARARLNEAAFQALRNAGRDASSAAAALFKTVAADAGLLLALLGADVIRAKLDELIAARLSDMNGSTQAHTQFGFLKSSGMTIATATYLPVSL